jgi:hypothetical protein
MKSIFITSEFESLVPVCGLDVFKVICILFVVLIDLLAEQGNGVPESKGN